MTRIFIDGSAGTTGLRIHDRLKERKDLELITLTGELRKDPEARKRQFLMRMWLFCASRMPLRSRQWHSRKEAIR